MDPSTGEQMSDLSVHPSKWSVARVLEFVGELGLDHLKPAFQKNVVDGEQLLDLSYTDLEEDLEIDNQEEIHRILGAINYLRSSYKKKRPKGDSRYGSNDDDGEEDEEAEEDETNHRNLHSQHMHASNQHSGHVYNQYSLHHPAQMGPSFASMTPYHVPARVPLLPLAALHEHSPFPWTIKARVINKTEMLQWNDTTHFFTLDLADPQQECSMRAMLVNEVADKFHPLVEIGKTYLVYSGGSKVQRAAHRFPHLTSDHEINLAIDAEITFIPEEEIEHSHIPVQPHVHPQEVQWNQPSELPDENSVPHAHGQDVGYVDANVVPSSSGSHSHSLSHPPADSSSSSQAHHSLNSRLNLDSSTSSAAAAPQPAPSASSPSLSLTTDTNGESSSLHLPQHQSPLPSSSLRPSPHSSGLSDVVTSVAKRRKLDDSSGMADSLPDRIP